MSHQRPHVDRSIVPDDTERIAGHDLGTVAERTLAYARKRDYTGWDYGDGMSSRLLSVLPVEHRYLNLAVQETVKRFPLNLRPLFVVERRRNLKGAALFVLANLHAGSRFGEDPYLGEARDLADWLLEIRPEGYSGFCLYHPHDLQTVEGVVPKGTPGVVGTCYGVQALLRAADWFGEDPYAEEALSAADFILEDLEFTRAPGGARINYKAADSTDHYTLNAVALGARTLLDLHERFERSHHLRAAIDLLEYVASRQTDLGGWHYRDPPEASHLSMDSHHNGFIIETFQRYRALVDDRFDETLDEAMAFYRDRLFEPDGAPNFDEDRAYPRDIHAAAQGILVFADVAGSGHREPDPEDLRRARDVIEWTLGHLYLGGGRFSFRKHRFHEKRHVLMRWGVAWMAYALTSYLIRNSGTDL